MGTSDYLDWVFCEQSYPKKLIAILINSSKLPLLMEYFVLCVPKNLVI